MSIDTLQDKIRKKKNPLMVDFSVLPSQIPAHVLDSAGSVCRATEVVCRELLTALRPIVPAVRFSFSVFGLMGRNGLELLQELLKEASAQGYYVLLDCPEMASPAAAEYTALSLLGRDSVWKCDGVVIPTYMGSDILKAFLPYCSDDKKDLFCVVRTPNKSASEVQDLLSGTRLVHLAAAERVARYSDGTKGKCGYNRVAMVTSAGSPESVRSLRTKYPASFLLVDGLDYPSSNMKNAAYGFDRLGHGAVVCAGGMVTSAWQTEGADGLDYVQHAVNAAEKIRKNTARYMTIL